MMQILVISWSPFFWWRGYLPSNKEYNYEPSTLLETLLIFEGDLRFEDHLNCFSNIFTRTFDDIMDDYNALKEMFEEKLSFVERYGDHNDNLKDFELNAESKQVFAALFSGDVVGHSNKSLKLVGFNCAFSHVNFEGKQKCEHEFMLFEQSPACPSVLFEKLSKIHKLSGL